MVLVKHCLVPGSGPHVGEQPGAKEGSSLFLSSSAEGVKCDLCATWKMRATRRELLLPPLHQDIPGPSDTAPGDSEGLVPVHSEG